jgi:hypothetical protein
MRKIQTIHKLLDVAISLLEEEEEKYLIGSYGDCIISEMKAGIDHARNTAIGYTAYLEEKEKLNSPFNIKTYE